METPKLTETEKEVLRLITDEFLTLKQIILRRHCSKQAVYKIVKSLKQKGCLNLSLQKVDKSQWDSQPNITQGNNLNQIRLHGQEFNIKILWQDNRYQEILNKSNIIYLDGHIIRLYKNSIEVYAGEGISFYADEANRAEKKSLIYWIRFFAKLEHNLKAIVLKNGCSNISIVNQHFERGGSEICEKSLEENRILKVYTSDDGKLWFWTDYSFNGINDETGHPKTAKPDRIEIDKHLNDWRNNHPFTNSELQALFTKQLEVIMNQEHLNQEQQELTKEILQVNKGFSDNIVLHMDVLNSMKDTMKGIDSGINFLVNHFTKDKVEKSLFKTMEKNYKKKINGNQSILDKYFK